MTNLMGDFTGLDYAVLANMLLSFVEGQIWHAEKGAAESF